jgi:hypothetical protein
MQSIFLTPEELEELTHRKRYEAQVRALRFMGIEHRVRPDATVAVLRRHVEQVLGYCSEPDSPPEDIEPDWSAI